MKKVIQKAAHLCGYRIISKDHLAARFAEQSPSAGLFEALVVRSCGTLNGLRFLQVGANDGQRMDPIAHLINDHGWSGVMLEPLPAVFSALKKFRGHHPRLTLLNAAVDSAPGTRLIYQIPDGTPGAPEWVSALASFDRNRLTEATRSLNLPDSCVVAAEVATTTWSELWARFAPTKCDVLVIDTEGHDIALLRMADLAQHQPRVILFEHACNPLEERLTFYRELIELGYELATLGPDTVAYRPHS